MSCRTTSAAAGAGIRNQRSDIQALIQDRPPLARRQARRARNHSARYALTWSGAVAFVPPPQPERDQLLLELGIVEMRRRWFALGARLAAFRPHVFGELLFGHEPPAVVPGPAGDRFVFDEQR